MTFLAKQLFPVVAKLLAGAVYAIVHTPFGWTFGKLLVLFVIGTLFPSIFLGGVLGMCALYRGRPWGLIVTLATHVALALTTICPALVLLARASGDTSQISYRYLIFGLSILGLSGALLLSSSARRFCGKQDWTRAVITLKGMLLGIAFSALYFCLTSLVSEFSSWLKT